MVWFKQWFGTRYYALLYGHRDEADAAAWVGSIMDRWRLPAGARVLDLGCGRGRHAAQFVLHGVHVTGIDLSEESIASARESVQLGKFFVQDMREPFGTASFDGISCLFTSLGYFEAKRDDEVVFGNVAEALKPGGQFVLDFMNAPAVLRDLVPTEVVERDGVRFMIQRAVEEGVLVKRIAVKDDEGEHHFEERVQALLPGELQSMVRQAGLVVEACTDGPVPRPFDPEHSQRFVLWARKPLA